MGKKILVVLVMFAVLFGINQTDRVAIAQEKDKHIIVEIGSQKFDAVLTNEEAANEFYGKLPLTLNMSELNGNEKYNYLPDSYTTNSKVANTIENGDIKLYGSSCMVLFYKTFSSGYSYTDIGKITNPKGLAEAVGQGNVSVTFRTAQAKVRLNYSKKKLVVGDKIFLKVIGNSKKVKWSSSKKTVASVGTNGKVTAKRPGKSVITAKVGKKKYKCEITVLTNK